MSGKGLSMGMGIGLSGRRRGGAGAYAAVPVHFDGSNDLLKRGGNLTGSVDGPLFLTSFWARRIGTGAFQRVFTNTGPRVAAYFDTSDRMTVSLARADLGLSILAITTAIEDNDWHHYMASFDTGQEAARHFRVDDVSDIGAGTNPSFDIAFNRDEWAVGAATNNFGLLNGDLAVLQLWLTYRDLSVEANRRLFITADGKPVDPAIAAAELGDPIILLGGAGRTVANWHENVGTGGGFTVSGALSDGHVPVEVGSGP